ncbi:MAG: type IX secretion system membrane protein PorP/SprF [Marinilabiliaceae bacterium]|nr:type IX secretion system membrane protein PorP/SprF [Marinilabiliaceae bacterium]
MNFKSKIKYYIAPFIITVLLIAPLKLAGQIDQLSTQYMNNYLLINPAYTGMHNALATTMSARHQWLGIDGAPKSYILSIHSPINKSYTSIGGLIKRYEQGPVQINKADFTYSYLVKFKAPVMLSLGLSAGATQTAINLTGLSTVYGNDPYLMENYSNAVKPNFGFGAFLYTPTLYLGLSIPELLELNYKNENNNIYSNKRAYYLSGGYTHKIDRKWSFKPSFLIRYSTLGTLTSDISGVLHYKSLYCAGLLYRTNQTAAALIHLNLTENLGICYSYEMSVNPTVYYQNSSHEISITYDIYSFYKRSKHRRFSKKSPEIEEGMKSMRYF